MGMAAEWISVVLLLLVITTTSSAQELKDAEELGGAKPFDGDLHDPNSWPMYPRNEGQRHDDRGRDDDDRGHHHDPWHPRPGRGRDRGGRRGPGFPPAGSSKTVAGTVVCSHCSALDTPLFGTGTHLLCPHPTKPPGHGGRAVDELLRVSSSQTLIDGSFHLPVDASYATVLDRCVVAIDPSSDANCNLPPDTGSNMALSTKMTSSIHGTSLVYMLASFSFRPAQTPASCETTTKRNLLQATSYQNPRHHHQVHDQYRKQNAMAHRLAVGQIPRQGVPAIYSYNYPAAKNCRKLLQTIPPIPAIPPIPPIPQIPAIPAIPAVPWVPSTSTDVPASIDQFSHIGVEIPSSQ